MERVRYSAIIIGLVFLASCANIQGSLSGGEKDETPPKIIVEKSTVNFQTNFMPKEIVLTYDEWVNIKTGSENIFISPLMNRRPEFDLVGKQLRIKFGQEIILQDSTTYQIQLIDAVQDLTEKNSAEAFTFVFSTGPFLDSLEISGTVHSDDRNGEVENAQIMLYKNWRDTIFSAQEVSYITKLDSAGQFRFTNLPESSFQLIAFDDKNKNGRYEPYEEAVGFLNSSIEPSDSIYDIHLVTLPRDLKIVEVDSTYEDYLRLKFNQSTPDFIVDCNCDYRRQSSDEYLFYLYPEDYPHEIMLRDTVTSWGDTVTLRDRGGDQYLVELSGPVTALQSTAKQKIGVSTSVMSGLLDTTLAIMNNDSLIDQKKARYQDGFLYLENASLNGLDSVVRLAILPGQWDSSRGVKDTLAINYDAKRYSTSSLLLDVTNLGNDEQYILSIKDNSDRLVKRFVLNTVTDTASLEIALLPGKFYAEIVWDEDRNGRWTYGSPDDLGENERKWYFEIPEMRLNWDVEHTITIP